MHHRPTAASFSCRALATDLSPNHSLVPLTSTVAFQLASMPLSPGVRLQVKGQGHPTARATTPPLLPTSRRCSRTSECTLLTSHSSMELDISFQQSSHEGWMVQLMNCVPTAGSALVALSQTVSSPCNGAGASTPQRGCCSRSPFPSAPTLPSSATATRLSMAAPRWGSCTHPVAHYVARPG